MVLATGSYTPETNYLSALDYGNDDGVQYTYDSLGRTVAQTWEDNDTVTYAYDNSGGLASVHDSALGRTTKYYYDFTDRLMKYAVTGSSYSHSVEYKYDATNKLLELVETVNGTVLTTSYTYDKDNRVTSVTTETKTAAATTSVTEEYIYDSYGRLESKVTKQNGSTVLTETYTYKTHDGKPTTQVASVIVKNGSNVVQHSCTYDYDSNGNIVAANSNGYSYSYAYDSANQLVRENNSRLGKTWTWTYDNAGNILEKKEYAYTTGELGTALDTVTYTYGEKGQSGGWGDLLTGYDGQTLNYDTVGNLLTDGTWDYTWEHGRQLQKMSKTDNSAEWTFTYDADGMRTGRTNGTTTYSYTYNGGQLTQMTLNGEPVTFTYNASGKPETMTYQGVTYYYVTNLQGDVVGIMDGSGNRLVYYYYTAYGTATVSMNSNYTPLATSLIAANPLTYRGYVYDQGTSLYYLQSRYYNPNTGRFLNADSLVSTGQGILGNNMFAYCRSNPVCRIDVLGTIEEDILGDEAKIDLTPQIDGGRMGGASRSPGSDYVGYNNGTGNRYYTFSSNDLLNEHYSKHNRSFGYAYNSPEAYLDDANYVIQNGEYIGPPYNGYIKFYGLNGGANYAFVGMSRDHEYITTFHIRPAEEFFH